MNSEQESQEDKVILDEESTDEQKEDLKPQPRPKLAPRGIEAFTVCRTYDESGVSGEGVIIEGVVLGTGQCIVHWLYPPPRGGIAIFDSMSDFTPGIEINKLKRSIVKRFWLDLEGIAAPDTFEVLWSKGKWESTLGKSAACRPFVNAESRSTRTLDESLGWNEEAFKAFVKALRTIQIKRQSPYRLCLASNQSCSGPAGASCPVILRHRCQDHSPGWGLCLRIQNFSRGYPHGLLLSLCRFRCNHLFVSW